VTACYIADTRFLSTPSVRSPVCPFSLCLWPWHFAYVRVMTTAALALKVNLNQNPNANAVGLTSILSRGHFLGMVERLCVCCMPAGVKGRYFLGGEIILWHRLTDSPLDLAGSPPQTHGGVLASAVDRAELSLNSRHTHDRFALTQPRNYYLYKLSDLWTALLSTFDELNVV